MKKKDIIDKLNRAQAIYLLDEYYHEHPREKYPKYKEYTLHEIKLCIRMFNIKLIEIFT